MFDLTGKTALVTGATGPIGGSIARRNTGAQAADGFKLECESPAGQMRAEDEEDGSTGQNGQLGPDGQKALGPT